MLPDKPSMITKLDKIPTYIDIVYYWTNLRRFELLKPNSSTLTFFISDSQSRISTITVKNSGLSTWSQFRQSCSKGQPGVWCFHDLRKKLCHEIIFMPQIILWSFDHTLWPLANIAWHLQYTLASLAEMWRLYCISK